MRTINLFAMKSNGGLCHFDLPSQKSSACGYVRFAGYIKFPSSAISDVSVSCDFFEIGKGSLRPRKDLPDNPLGFDFYVSSINLPKRFLLTVSVVSEGIPILLGTIAGEGELSPCVIGPMPALICGLGRSGTTHLMSKLARNPLIAAVDRYPYESLSSVYYSKACELILTPCDRLQDDYKHFISGSSMSKNPFTFGDYLSDGEISSHSRSQWTESINFFGELIRKYYRAVCKNPSELRYFLEKDNISFNPIRLLNIFGDVRVIFLTRNPYDIFLSRKRFLQKRGEAAGFGRSATDDDSSWIKKMGYEFVAMTSLWGLLDESCRLHVKYEDLISSPNDTILKISHFLGVDFLNSRADSEVDTAWEGMHRTLDNAATAESHTEFDKAAIIEVKAASINYSSLFSY